VGGCTRNCSRGLEDDVCGKRARDEREKWGGVEEREEMK